MFTRRSLIALAAASPLLAQAESTTNALTPAEKKAGWKLLFDGHSYTNWRDPSKNQPPSDGWTIEDGCLKALAHPRITEDLVSTDTYRNFELAWDWRLSQGGNSGVKFRIQDFVVLTKANRNPQTRKFEDMVDYVMEQHLSDRAKIGPEDRAQVYVIGFEYQMIDDERHPDAKRGDNHCTGALYDIQAPSSHPTRPAGEWNSSRLIVNGDHVEEWLNGVKTIDTSLKSPAVEEHSAARWGKDSPVCKLLVEQPKQDCPISLQNHGDAPAWFRNIRIRKI